MDQNKILSQQNSGDMTPGSDDVKTSSLQVKNLKACVMHAQANRGHIDTAAPFESVKAAVSKFGGIVDWKAHKVQTLERHKYVQLELDQLREEIPVYKKQSEVAEDENTQLLKELDGTKRLIEELKLKLEKAETEEAQANQDAELAQLRVKEVKQGIAGEASVAAQAELDVAKSRHSAAVAELKSVKDELEMTRQEYVSSLAEKDVAIKKAEEAVSKSREVEKTVEDLTLELITAKQLLESAHAAHMEAEENRIGVALAKDQDYHDWENELKQAEDEVQQLTEKLLAMKDVQSKLDTASAMLHNLKGELAAYVEANLNDESERITGDGPKDDSKEVNSSAEKELEEVKADIEKAKEEANYLRVAASSLKVELETEAAALATLKQKEQLAAVEVSSLQAELSRIEAEIEIVQAREQDAQNQMMELPESLQRVSQEADEAKAIAHLAREELQKAQEKAQQAKASAYTMQSRLRSALKEIEAAKASERLALDAIRALQESEQAASVGQDPQNGVTLPLEEYYVLSKRAHDAEEQASDRVTAALSQVEQAKESESKTLERLMQAEAELEEKKELLRLATEKAEDANEGKLAVEQELREWRSVNEQRRKASEVSHDIFNPSKSTRTSFEESREANSFVLLQQQQQTSLPACRSSSTKSTKNNQSDKSSENGDPEQKAKKKKKSFFPRIVMFLARKKSQPVK